jgi:hypothetical protein
MAVRIDDIDTSAAENFLQQSELANFLASEASTPRVLAEISNTYRAEALGLRDPSLFSRYGKPLSPSLENPTNRIVLSQPSPISPVRQSYIPDKPPLEVRRRSELDVVSPEDLSFAQKKLDQFEGRINRSLDRLGEARRSEDVDAIFREEARLRVLRSELYEVYADYPELAVQSAVRQLPDEIRPLSNASQRTAERYVLTQRRFFSETSVLREMRDQMAVLEQQVRGQQSALRMLPPLERVNPASEFATRRNYGLPTFSSIRELNLPSTSIRADIDRLLTPGTVENLIELRNRTPELQDLSVNQLARAIDNNDNVTLDRATNQVRRVAEDTQVPARNQRQQIVDYIAENEGIPPQAADNLVPAELRPGTVTRFDETVTPEQLEWMESTGQPYIEPIVASRAELRNLFDDPDATVVRGREAGIVGTDDEVLARFANAGSASGSAANQNIYPVRFTDELPTPTSQVQRVSEDVQEPLTRLSDRDDVDPVYSKVFDRLRQRRLGDEMDMDSFYNAMQGPQRYADDILDKAIDSGLVERTDDGVRFVRNIPEGQVDEAVSAATGTSDDFGEWWEWMEQSPVAQVAVEPNYYHGTKALHINVEGAQSFSLSNEFGPGLYLARDRETATRYARAMPANDTIATGDMRPSLTNQGRVFPVYMRPEANVLMVSDLDDKAVRKVYRNLFRENLPEEFRQRFFNWSRNKPFDQWYHYIRSQFSKAFGQDSQYSYAEWVVENNRRLAASGIDAIEDNEGNLTVLNPEVLRVFSAVADEQDTGSIAEGLLERYRADLDLHRRLNNSTTKSILEQDRLDIMTYYRDQMADAVGSQEKRAIRSVEEMEKAEELLATEVRRERKALEASRIRESEIDSVRQGNRSARQSNDNFPCL